MMIAKLEAYILGLNSISKNYDESFSISHINVEELFDKAKKDISNNTSINEETTKEILEQIEFLEKLINSNMNKKEKWQQTKPFISWLMDQSVDLGMTLLPLMLAIQ